MEKIIKIRIDSLELEALLNNSHTAEAIWEALPIVARANTWGDGEIYFSIPVHLELENGQELVEKGDLGYWPTGNAFGIYFGPTPLSLGTEIRPASAVTVFGEVLGDATGLKSVRTGAEVTVERKAE